MNACVCCLSVCCRLVMYPCLIAFIFIWFRFLIKTEYTIFLFVRFCVNGWISGCMRVWWCTSDVDSMAIHVQQGRLVYVACHCHCRTRSQHPMRKDSALYNDGDGNDTNNNNHSIWMVIWKAWNCGFVASNVLQSTKFHFANIACNRINVFTIIFFELVVVVFVISSFVVNRFPLSSISIKR